MKIKELRNPQIQRLRAGPAVMLFLALVLVFPGATATADPGDVMETPNTPMELPVEIEVETGPASLKQAPLWKELFQLLDDPYAAPVEGTSFGPSTIERRPGFGVAMPALNVWPLGYNFLTGQPLRLRTSDGEVSWDQPGFLFDPEEVVAVSSEPADPNVPIEQRSAIGALVTCIEDDGDITAAEQQFRPGGPCEDAPVGSMVVSNPRQRGLRNNLGYTSIDCTGPGPNNGCADPRIPPHRTVVAVAAVVDGVLHELDPDNGGLEPVTELEIPINEEDFFRDPADVTGVPVDLQPYIGRPAADILGKANFWDMQVGSDNVQACGTCHFHAGVDNRTRNQLNPNTTGGDLTLQVVGPNEAVAASDFPFRRLADVDGTSEGPGASAVTRDSNDVMSSMGVSKFTIFEDVIVGPGAFGPAFNGVAPLLPDLGDGNVLDPVPVFQPEIIGDGLGNDDGICTQDELELGGCTSLRRVEPRHTPTFHGAAFNFDNFWDGRARFNFNGGSVFGPSDPQAHIFINEGGGITGATNGHINEDLIEEDPEAAEQPVRIKFSSLGSQAVGPPLSEFEMSFFGRNWPKIGKKLLQAGVTPLANQLVDPNDSVLGPFSNQLAVPGTPGLNISYLQLIQLAFAPEFWDVLDMHLAGAPDGSDPFDNYSLTIADGAPDSLNTNQFTQAEANFSLFFAMGVQAYESLTIPDHTLFDQFMDANPLAANAVGQPGEQGVLYPTLVPQLVGGSLTLIPDDPSTPEYDGFGPDELFGWDIFAGSNATAALAPGEAVDPVSGVNRNPDGLGSNPFARTSRCMLCHLGPEQTDHSINISHGVIKGDAEVEFPTPPTWIDPFGLEVPAPEPPGPIAAVGGLILAEEVTEGSAQDAVEVEPRNFATFDDPSTPWDDRNVAQPKRFSFGDQGVYNIGVRPNFEDIGRGGDDPFGWPLSLSALTLMNIDIAFVPGTAMANFDPFDIEASFEETGDGAFFPGTTHTLQSINPGFERDTINPMLPDYMVPWIHSLPAGELHPSIDEMAGFLPNTVTQPNGGPAIEFGENFFGADLHCGIYDPGAFGSGPPNHGWGPNCPNNQSGVTGNIGVEVDDPYVPGSLVAPVHGTWPGPNQVLKDGAFKAPMLRNVELTGPYFHTGSYLTLRQVVDFYMRGGDFPITNADDKDPHMLDIEEQAFGFGTVRTFDENGDPTQLGTFQDETIDGVHLIGYFADALPDTAFQYDPMPDSDHDWTPEPETSTQEAAKVALVRFLLSFTDPRVKYERAPFDRPEIFVPVDGRAPENTGGRPDLVTQSNCSIATPCTLSGPDGILATPDDIIVTEPLFRHVTAVGEAGNLTPLPNFLGISSTPIPGENNDHFDR